ncbi:MAG: S8 family serine peptidase [Rubrivivax sp.]|nr:S8 family serine peptidase [Rubrivivax sp.]
MFRTLCRACARMAAAGAAAGALASVSPLAVTFAITSLGLATAAAWAQATQPRIEKAADLPRFTYKVAGPLEDIVRSADRFAPFAAALRRDTQGVLDAYDIPDHATKRDLVTRIALLDYLDGRYDEALARAEEVRGLQDKPADKLLSGLRLRVMAAAAKAHGPAGEAFQRAVAEGIARELAPLPYAVIANDIRELKQGAELIGEGLILGRVREVMQPIATSTGALSSDFAPGLVYARFGLLATLPLKATFTAAFGAYLDAHKVVKPDIWAAREAVLDPAAWPGRKLAPVRISVWDSGVDVSLFGDRVVRDAKGRPVFIAYDKYGRPSKSLLVPLPEAVRARLPELTAMTKGFSDPRLYFEMQKKALTEAFAGAPGILFVTAAGNSNNDPAFVEDIPAAIVLPNLLTVGAVDQAGDEASFTSCGKMVKVHANGYQVESYLPGGTRVALSGTSMAAPQVANLAAKLLAIDPELTPPQVIEVIVQTAERTADGRRNLIHPKRAVEVVRGR